eukprot:8666-Lingulodinium_polyedra.AAC.1
MVKVAAKKEAKASSSTKQDMQVVAASSSQSMGKNSAQQVTDMLKRLDRGGRPYPLVAYRALKSHQEKRSFAAQLFVDREASFLEVQEKHWNESEETKEVKKGWMYGWDICKLNGVQWSDAPDSSCLKWLQAAVEDCECRDAPDPAFAKMGFKQWYYSKGMADTERHRIGKKVVGSASAKVESEQEFEQLLGSMG